MTDWALDYVKHVLATKNWSANRLAQEADLAASTINRPLRDPDYPNKLSRDTIKKIAEASGIDPGPFVPNAAQEPPSSFALRSMPPRPETRADRALRNLPPPQSPKSAPAISVSVENGLATIVATVDRAGLARLRRKLDAVEALLDESDDGAGP